MGVVRRKACLGVNGRPHSYRRPEAFVRIGIGTLLLIIILLIILL